MGSSIHYTCAEKIQTIIRDLNLTGLADSNVVITQQPVDLKKTIPGYPCVLIAPFGSERLPGSGGTNVADVIAYPVFVLLLDKKQSIDLSTLDTRLHWRQQFIDALIHRRLSGITDYFDTFIEPSPAVDPGAWFQRELFVSAFTARCEVQKKRRQ